MGESPQSLDRDEVAGALRKARMSCQGHVHPPPTQITHRRNRIGYPVEGQYILARIRNPFEQPCLNS